LAFEDVINATENLMRNIVSEQEVLAVSTKHNYRQESVFYKKATHN
jgi:hypothetical protein